jgi:Flp pilus assembly protein TadG
MIRTLRRFLGNTDATAAVEAAIFSPIFLLLTLGVTDLGTGMFVEMQVNAATQSGAAYAVINHSKIVPPNTTPICASMTLNCLSSIQKAMSDAIGNSSFCTATAQNRTPCTASFTSCAEANGGICFTVSANYPFSPILPVTGGVFAKSWTKTTTYSSTVTVRVPTS